MYRFLLIVLVAVMVGWVDAALKTVKVSGGDYTSVQAAIDALSTGDTIDIYGSFTSSAYIAPKQDQLIRGRTYTGNNVFLVSDTVQRQGSSGDGPVFYITTTGVRIQNLVIQPAEGSTNTRNWLYYDGICSGSDVSCVQFLDNGCTIGGNYFNRSGSTVHNTLMRMHNIYVKKGAIVSGIDARWYLISEHVSIDTVWADSSRFILGDSSSIRNFRIYGITGECMLRGSTNDTIENGFIDARGLSAEVFTLDEAYLRVSKNVYVHNFIIANSVHEPTCFDALQYSTIDGFLSTMTSNGAMFYNHNNSVAGPNMHHTIIEHWSDLGHSVDGPIFFASDTIGTPTGSSDFRYSKGLILSGGHTSSMVYAITDTLDSTVAIRGHDVLLNTNSPTTFKDTILNAGSSALRDTIRYGYWNRTAAKKGVWSNGSHSGFHKYLIENIGHPQASGSGYALKGYLDSLFWFDYPVEKDSATIWLIDSIGGSWTKRDSAVMQRAGWSDSLRYNNPADGKHFTKLVVLTSSSSGNITDTTEIDSITISNAPPTKHYSSPTGTVTSNINQAYKMEWI